MAPRRSSGLLVRADNAIIGFFRLYGLRLLRYALGTVFFWFGLLKVIGHSPVDELVASMAYGMPAEAAIIALGTLEMLIGIGIISGVLIRVTLLLLVVQMLGSFAVFVVHPQVAFQGGNPLLLTVEGEFIVKNLVLLAAALAVASSIPRMRPGEGLGQALRQRATEPAEIRARD